MNEYKYEIPRIYYREEKPYTSSDEYHKFYKQIQENCEQDKELIKQNELKYFERSTQKIKKLIEKNIESNKDMNRYILFTQIDHKNQEEFKEMIEDLLKQYQYLKSLDDDKINYNYFKRLMSWYKLSIRSLEDAVNNLSKNDVDVSDLKEIRFENSEMIIKYIEE